MDNLQEQIEQVKKKYIEKLPEKFSQIQAVEEKLLSDNPDINDFNELKLLAHSICGSSGMFGISLLSEKAYNIEIYLKQCEKEAKLPDLNKIPLMLNELKEVYKELVSK